MCVKLDINEDELQRIIKKNSKVSSPCSWVLQTIKKTEMA
jgi:hypothetical protein